MAASFLLFILSLGALLRTGSATYAITGAHGGVNAQTGARPFRQNLKDFQGSGPAFDLYIQALSQFQKNDQGNLLSWYEVAGEWHDYTGGSSRKNGFADQKFLV
jgi:tyrosinase